MYLLSCKFEFDYPAVNLALSDFHLHIFTSALLSFMPYKNSKDKRWSKERKGSTSFIFLFIVIIVELLIKVSALWVILIHCRADCLQMKNALVMQVFTVGMKVTETIHFGLSYRLCTNHGNQVNCAFRLRDTDPAWWFPAKLVQDM